MSGREVVQRTPGQELIAQINAPVFREQVQAALPDNVPARRFVRATITALHANPDLANAEHGSVLTALIRSAQDGLMPDGAQAAIVTYRDNKTQTNKAQYLPMVAGVRARVAEFGWAIDARVVYQADRFRHEEGLDPVLEHVPAAGDRGEMVAVYAIGRHRDGRRQHEVMYPPDVARAMKSSKTAGSANGPWKTHTARMWEKTAVHALVKRLALDANDVRLHRMLSVDDLAPGEAQDKLYGPARVADGTVVRAPAVAGELPPAESSVPETPVPAGPHADLDAQPPAREDTRQAAGTEDTEPVVDVEPEGAAGTGALTLEQARLYTFTRGVNEGKSLGAIASAPGALTWYGWSLNNLASFEPDLAAAVRLVAEHDVPEAWARHTAKGGRS